MVRIERELYKKLETLVRGISTEVAGLLVGDIEDGVLVIKDIIVPEQDATCGDVEFKETDLIEVRKDMTDEQWRRVIGHWHSHISMGCFWSSTDEELIETFSKTRKKSVFIVSSVKEGRFESRLRIVLNDPFKIDVDEMDFEVTQEEEDKTFLDEVKKKIREPKGTIWDRGGYGQSNYGYGTGTRDGWEEEDFENPWNFKTKEGSCFYNLDKSHKKKIIRKFPELAKPIMWDQEGKPKKWNLKFRCGSPSMLLSLEAGVRAILGIKEDSEIEEETIEDKTAIDPSDEKFLKLMAKEAGEEENKSK